MPAVFSRYVLNAVMPTSIHSLGLQRQILARKWIKFVFSKSRGIPYSSVLGATHRGQLLCYGIPLKHTPAPLHTSVTLMNAQKNPPQAPSDKQSKRENDEKEKPEEQNTKKPPTILLVLMLLLSAIPLVASYITAKDQRRTVDWNEFVTDYLWKGEVESIYAFKGINEVHAVLYPGAVIESKSQQRRTEQVSPQGGQRQIKIDVPIDKVEHLLKEAEQKMGINSANSLSIVWNDVSTQMTTFQLLTLAFFVWLLVGAFRSLRHSISVTNPFEALTKVAYTRGDISSSSSAPKIRFRDIAGMKEAKVEIKEYVEYLKNPSKFQNLGAKIPRGALLLGPPGCGKTLLAKAVAAESEVPFLVMAGSDFVEMIGGLGASRIRSLFKDARGLTPCIIYIDEIDALGRSRAGSGDTGMGGSEAEHTLNQLLVEMDGMNDNSGVIMLASTNRADVLDKALLRPGRFDRHINIDLPTLSERKELFQLYLKKINLSKPIGQLENFLAQATPGMSGADIANICNEAALNAAREGSNKVQDSNLTYALDRVLAGQARVSNAISQEEKKTIAFHECGHVLVSWMLESTDALLKVSVIPRTSAALGFAQYMPSDRKLYSKQDLFERMCVLLGGRAAETIVFNRVTTGAQDDLDKVSKLAYGQIKQYGMGDSVGLLAFPSDEREDYQNKPYSKALQRQIDMEAQQLISKAYKTAEQLILTNRSKLDKLCDLLLKQEEMTYDDVKAAIGAPPHGEKKVIDMHS